MGRITNWPLVGAGVAVLLVGLAVTAYGVSSMFSSIETFSPSFGLSGFGLAAGGMMGIFVGSAIVYLGAVYYPARSVLGAVTDVASSVSASVESSRRVEGAWSGQGSSSAFCQSCGQGVPRDPAVVFCPHCGARLLR